MKKFFAILLACALVFSTLPVLAFAEDHEDHGEHDVVTEEIQCICADKQPDVEEFVESVEANCVSVAYDVYLCGDCGLFYTIVTSGTNANNHVGTRTIEGKAPTCTEEGYEAYWECYYEHDGKVISCGASNKADKIIPATGHNYTPVVTDPTCTEDGYTTYTCGNCDDSYQSDIVTATGHSYETVVTNPTCEEQGYTTYTCACGHSYVDNYVAATGHDYETVVTDPTCTEDGYTTYTCACGHSYVDNYVDATGHSYETVVTNPTCEEQGYTTYTCACGHSYVGDYVTATGHNYQEVGRVEADCFDNDGVIYFECECGATKEEVISSPNKHTYTVTEIGATCTEPAKLYHVCTVCNHELTVNKDGSEPLRHDYGEWQQTTAPDCVNEGEETAYCSRCEDFKTRPVAALGHTEETISAVPAGCETTGLTEGTKCSVCQEILVEQEVVGALGHTPEEITAVPNSCTEDGLTAGEKCSVCQKILVEQEVIPADPTAHVTAILSPRVEATCVAKGHTHTVGCSKCGFVIAEPQEIPINPDAHVLSSVVTAPTCVEDGYTTYTCTLGCGYTAINDVVEATGHNYEGDVTDPTCVDKGYTTYTCVNDPTHVYVDDYVDALGHTEGAVVVENEVAPGCVTDGGYDNVVYCTVCSTELSRETVVVPASGHSLEHVDAQAPGCTTIGWDAYEYCTVCDYTTYEELPENGHTYGQSAGIVNPTCTERGYEICVCSVCEQLFMDHYEDALGHTEGEIVVENEVAPGCVTDGSYDNVVYCTVCSTELSRETETVSALGHTEGEIVVENEVAPGCVTDGSYDNVVYCTVCSTELSRETETVSALGHTEVVDEAVAPNCTETGLTAGKHCSVCEEVLEAQQTVAALGHTEVVDEAVAPNCMETGLTAGKHCSVCEEVLEAQQTVAALGHTEVEDAAVAPTFDETGLTAGVHCSVCNVVIIEQEEIPTLGEMITFSYEVTGINGSEFTTNSGKIYLTIYVTVNEKYADVVNQARFWGVDLEIAFEDCVDLINANGSMFPVFQVTPYEIANANNTVKISSTLSLIEPDNFTFTAGTQTFAVLTFKVADDYVKQDVSFNVTDCKVIRNAEANELVVNNGIAENVEEGVDTPEATIYVAMLGDANLDGKITGDDSLQMSIWATSDEVANDVNAYDATFDLNKDGLINGQDFVLLGKAVVGDDEYLA